MRGAVKQTFVPAVLSAVVVLLALIGEAAGERDFVITTGIYLMLVVGLWTFTGVSGVLSFGHISFMAIGAYASALLTVPVATKSILLPDLPGLLADAAPSTVVSYLVAGAVAALVAAVVGIPLMRLSGLAASISTLALLVIVNTLISNADAITGGTTTLSSIPTSTTLPAIVVASVVAIVVAAAFGGSSSGLRLRASREDLAASRALGIRETRLRLIAFVLSAAVVGLAGAFYAHYLGSISADAFSFNVTFLTIAMLVVGGTTSLSGAIAGTLFISVITEVFQRLEDHGVLAAGWRQMALAAVVIAVLALRPTGLTRGRDIAVPKRWRSP